MCDISHVHCFDSSLQMHCFHTYLSIVSRREIEKKQNWRESESFTLDNSYLWFFEHQSRVICSKQNKNNQTKQSRAKLCVCDI